VPQIVVLSVALMAALLPGAQAPKPAVQWFEARSAHIRVVTNTDEATATGLARDFELFRTIFLLMTPEAQTKRSDPVVVLAFHDEESLSLYQLRRKGEFVRKHQGRAQFVRHPEGRYILLATPSDPSGSKRSLGTAYHEYVHYFVAERMGTGAPLWFNEGLAEYFSTFEIRDDLLVIGEPVSSHVRNLEHWRFLPFDRFLAVRTGADPLFLEDEPLFYAQSWALVHYLLSGDRDRVSRGAALLAALRRGESPEAACQKAFGYGLETLEKSLRAYLDSGTLPTRRTRINQLSEPTIRVEALPPKTVRKILGRFLRIKRETERTAGGRSPRPD